DTEKLYIGGGDPSGTPGGSLAVVDPTTLQVSVLGNLRSDTEYSPELTGTAAAELFGFYPGADTTFVPQIDKTRRPGPGQEDSIPGGLGSGDIGVAWGFAQWGGKFYLFVTTNDGFSDNSTVRTIDKATGAVDTPIENLPYDIVGAGVSTCAPDIIN